MICILCLPLSIFLVPNLQLPPVFIPLSIFMNKMDAKMNISENLILITTEKAN